jgi:hypothetical protein
MITLHDIYLGNYVTQAIDLLHVARTEPTNLSALKQVRIETQHLRAFKQSVGDVMPPVADALLQDYENQVIRQNKQHQCRFEPINELEAQTNETQGEYRNGY